MTTITGTLEDTSGSPVHCRVTFKSKSTPLVNGGIIIGTTTKTLKTDRTDGTFSVQLAAGKYNVTYETTPDQTKFEITVPDSNDTVTIGSVTSSLLTFVSVAPNTIWNGIRSGNITFDPIADPTSAFTLSIVPYTGGHITNEYYTYAVSYVTADGESALSLTQRFNPGPQTNSALRLTLLTGLTRVIKKRIWRTSDVGGTGQLNLLAEVAPGVATYDDWESNADFATRATFPPQPPDFNTTAGVIYSKAGQSILYFSISGLRVLSAAQFDVVASFEDAVQCAGDVKFIRSSVGPVLTAPTGTNWRVKVNNTGGLFTELT
jgi:hypothetical protein